MTQPSQPATRVLDLHQLSVAGRLLSGAGAADLVAYRRDPQVAHQVLAHALTSSGDLVVAVAEDIVGSEGRDVRLDLRREAAEPSVRITAATAHLLGRLDRVPVTMFEVLGVPQGIADLLDLPDIAVGLVRSDRVLLHHGSGVVRLGFGDIVAELGLERVFPAREDELAAHDVVAGFAPADLQALASAVIAGRLEGVLLSERPSVPTRESVAERVYCVDVDARGLTLMRVGDATTVTFIAFPEPIESAMDLFLALVGLLLKARS